MVLCRWAYVVDSDEKCMKAYREVTDFPEKLAADYCKFFMDCPRYGPWRLRSGQGPPQQPAGVQPTIQEDVEEEIVGVNMEDATPLPQGNTPPPLQTQMAHPVSSSGVQGKEGEEQQIEKEVSEKEEGEFTKSSESDDETESDDEDEASKMMSSKFHAKYFTRIFWWSVLYVSISSTTI